MKLLQRVANHMPRKFLFYCMIRAWAYTRKVYPDLLYSEIRAYHMVAALQGKPRPTLLEDADPDFIKGGKSEHP